MAFPKPEQPTGTNRPLITSDPSVEELDSFIAAERILRDVHATKQAMHNTLLASVQLSGMVHKNLLCPQSQTMGKELGFLFTTWSGRTNSNCNSAGAGFGLSMGLTLETGLLRTKYADFTSEITAMRDPSFDFGTFGRLYMDDLQAINATTYYYYENFYNIGKNFVDVSTRLEQDVYRAAFILPYVFTVTTNLIEQWQDTVGIANDPTLAAYMKHRYGGQTPSAGKYDASVHARLLADYHDLVSQVAPLTAITKEECQ
jgi:hypothetical protein